jgi:hypothetical protein
LSVKNSARKTLAGVAAVLLLAPGCAVGSSSAPTLKEFQPDVVAIPHALFDPSAADKIARRASYSAWVELNVAWGPQHTLDLAVWPNQAAARHALGQYRARGAETHPVLDNKAWPRKLRRVQRVRNITLAWYNQPSPADERAIKRALRFSGGAKAAHEYTALWLIPGTLIAPDATAATGSARYSARLEAAIPPGCPGSAATGSYNSRSSSPSRQCPGNYVTGPLTLAIWPSERAAIAYIHDYKDVSGPITRIRNVTLEVGDFSDADVSRADEAAVKNALH